MTVVLSGHGEFALDTNPPWVTVPPGATIYFYTENMRALLDSYGGEIESMSSVMSSITPNQTVYAGSSCPNYTLSAPDGLDIQDPPDDVYQHIVSSDTTLAQMIAQGIITGDVHWAACRVVDLAPAGGELLGVNAGQTTFGYEAGGGEVEVDTDERQVSAAQAWMDAFWALDEDSRVQAFTDLPSGYKRIYSDFDPRLGTWARQHEFLV